MKIITWLLISCGQEWQVITLLLISSGIKKANFTLATVM